MKFEIHNEKIPQEQREEINRKILYLIDNNIAEENGISQEIIANSYSGDGGLSGLKFNDYGNYHDFSEAKKQVENGQFFTPYAITDFIIKCLKPSKHDIIMDLTCGHGAFINSVPEEQNFYGCEIDIKSFKVGKYLYPNANITCGDIRLYKPEIRADLIVSNPPFNLKWQVGNTQYLSQLYYTIKASNCIKAGGIMALIVPNSFLADDFSDKGMIEEVQKNWNILCQFDISKDTFKALGVDNFPTKIMFFQRKSEHIEDVKYNTDKITVDNINDITAEKIYNSFIKPALTVKDKLKGKLFFETLHCKTQQEQDLFEYKVKKMLYDIKRNPKTSIKYTKCEEYIYKFQTQKQPEGMKYEEWQKKRITPNKVIAYLKRVMKEQNRVEIDKIELVKTNYGLKLKPYSRKMKTQLSKTGIIKEMSINDMVINKQYPFEDKKFQKLINRNRKQFELQTQNFNDMTLNTNIQNFVENVSFYDSVKEETIKLNDVQKNDINKMLQKNYGLLQYSMGGGKTLQGITYSLYRLKYNNILNPIIIGESIAIKGTWMEVLENYNIPYCVINKVSDLKNIEKGKFILITLYNVNKYKKQIKKYLKMNVKKFALIFDESDSITSLDTQAYKSVLSCFRKLVRYKLLLTGTSTRNNINESFGQFELLYNNSINMLCMASTIYDTNKKDNKIEPEKNDFYLKPFPAYKQGYNLFRKTFSPAKATVFGMDKYNQDIYNSDELSDLLNYTIITKTFKEITGREAFDGKVIPCYMSKGEEFYYNEIITEFHKLERLYYSSTGNSRKDAMLRALHQLNLLLRACSRFHIMSLGDNVVSDYGYNRNIISNKHKEVINCIKSIGKQRCAIGCIEKASCREYERILKNEFPNRMIFIVDGEKYNITQRKNLIKEFKKYDDCIVVATQSSLSCSLNIGFIDEIIIPELQWNNSRIEQYAFRFIRYDSQNLKNVRFILYANSIEINLLKLIMVKEKINMFMKGEDWTEEQLKSKYGIDFEMEEMLMYKERDEEGNLKIVWNQWGEQKIS